MLDIKSEQLKLVMGVDWIINPESELTLIVYKSHSVDLLLKCNICYSIMDTSEIILCILVTRYCNITQNRQNHSLFES